MVMYYVYMKLPVADLNKRSQSALGVLVYKIWGANLGLGIIISHDFVENLLKTAEPTCDQPYTLWGEIYFLSSFQNQIVDSMAAYGYICRFKLETSSKDAKAHLGVLYEEKLKCQEAYLRMLVTSSIRILLSLLLAMFNV